MLSGGEGEARPRKVLERDGIAPNKVADSMGTKSNVFRINVSMRANFLQLTTNIRFRDRE